MKRSMALLGCVMVQALAVGQNSKQRDMDEMHRVIRGTTLQITAATSP